MSSQAANVLAVLLGVGLVVAVGLAWYFSAGARIKRQLRTATRFSIAEMPENTLGRLIGTAGPLDAPLTAPLTGRACVYYVASVEEQRTNGKTTYWRAIISESRGVPFVLADSTGRAIVDPEGAKVALDVDGKSHSGTFDDATPVEEGFLARHGAGSKGWLFNKGLRYREAVIEVGETIAVLGAGVREPDPEAAPAAAYRGTAPTRLRLTSGRSVPLLISDDRSTTT